MDHIITVGKLRELLAELKDEDELVPNDVANLIIYRDDHLIGWINLLENNQAVEIIEMAVNDKIVWR